MHEVRGGVTLFASFPVRFLTWKSNHQSLHAFPFLWNPFPHFKAGGGPHIEPQYRQPPQLTKHQKFQAELLSGAMWFWILWHVWHDPDAVLGHFPWPDTSAWTDEELGIPPDDEE
ncbi:NADH dehydrogenase [ubiquinone] 1 beta subcomplex subunit mitochondrial [Labeo rohita]|uniref:NADH dehydrogenase [ubiquinone] 1 beta subcomplex subunit 2, mitochondrial n=1 Tax=Labeo rohita TaxID=84645 RepID=A0A498LR93_LABRO|nr:NADH dehydrogenase [ubiquinone] 1 beta subcomplex subunit mitochondrial [Labeo rohita]